MSSFSTTIETNRLLPILECSLCLSLLCEPISLGCGHTFCRVCLFKALTRTQKRCPTCREVCHVTPENAPENVMLKSLVMTIDPSQYQARLEENQAEKATWSTLFPIFYYNSTLFPGNTLSLHLFEPRYKLMMQRIVNSTNAFAYVPNFKDYNARIGDIAVVVKLRKTEFLADGRCFLDSEAVSRNRIVDHYVEDGTQGLHYCRVEPVRDSPISEDNKEVVRAEYQRSQMLVNKLISHSNVRREIESQYGKQPSELESYSLWVTSLAPLCPQKKLVLLKSVNTLERLQVVNDVIDEYLQRAFSSLATAALSATGEAIAQAGGVLRDVVHAIIAGDADNEDEEDSETSSNASGNMDNEGIS